MFGSRNRFPAVSCFAAASCGFGYLALAGLMAEQAAADRRIRSRPKAPHFPPKAKRVIFLFMKGGPSHVDTFDYKPQLTADDGKTAGQQGNNNANRTFMPSPWKFKQHGKSGLCDLRAVPAPGQARRRAVPAQQHAHRPAEPPAGLPADAHRQLPVRAAVAGRVGAVRPGHREREPARLRHASTRRSRIGGAQNYGSAFLPAVYQGTRIGGEGESSPTPIPNIANGRVPPECSGGSST